MAKQNLTIKDVANLILSLSETNYFAQDSADGESFYIMNYISRDGISYTGNKLKITISKNKVKIFYFPSLNITVPVSNDNEFQELVSLYLDFKNKVDEYLFINIKSMITNKTNHKNPYDGYNVFMDMIRNMHNEDDRIQPQPRRARRQNDAPALEDLDFEVPDLPVV